MNYLLDTTLLIDTAYGAPAARALFERLFGGADALLTCDAIVAEALSGGDDEHIRAVRNLIDVLEYVTTHPDAARWAGDNRRRTGQTSRRRLGDALIAAVAWSTNATIVTRNPDDFIAQGIPVLTYG
jgi:predicted nucleic acid-binding protein